MSVPLTQALDPMFTARQILSIFLAITLTGCGGANDAVPAPNSSAADAQLDEQVEDYPPNDGGKPFLADLAEATRKSDRVVVVEHSYLYDTMTGNDSDQELPERKYKTVNLSPDQKVALVQMLRSVNPSVSMYASACIFEPHHRLEFYQGSKRLSTMEVCLKCNQQEWDGTKYGEPVAFYEGFASFVRSLGMRPDADWSELARSH